MESFKFKPRKYRVNKHWDNEKITLMQEWEDIPIPQLLRMFFGGLLMFFCLIFFTYIMLSFADYEGGNNNVPRTFQEKNIELQLNANSK